MRIILASGNAGKIQELQASLKQLNLQIIPQKDFGLSDIEETGLTFVENALIKARFASEETGLPAIADDSGLEVPALKGEPGIYSARYAGVNCSSKDNIEKLLEEMLNLPENQRIASFYCTLVYLAHPEDPTPLICEGRWHGLILKAPQGEKGFGYDPIFFDTTHQCSAAEMPLDLKNQISHRGQALKKLIEQLPEKLKG